MSRSTDSPGDRESEISPTLPSGAVAMSRTAPDGSSWTSNRSPLKWRRLLPASGPSLAPGISMSRAKPFTLEAPGASTLPWIEAAGWRSTTTSRDASVTSTGSDTRPPFLAVTFAEPGRRLTAMRPPSSATAMDVNAGLSTVTKALPEGAPPGSRTSMARVFGASSGGGATRSRCVVSPPASFTFSHLRTPDRLAFPALALKSPAGSSTR